MSLDPQLLATAFDSSLDALMVLGMDDEPVIWNRTYQQLWSVAPPEVRHYSAAELKAHIIEQLVQGAAEDFLIAVEPTPQFYQHYFQTLNGRWLRRRVTDFVDHDVKRGMLVAWSDVTHEHQRILDGQRERELLSELIEHVPDQIYFKDLESRFIKINPSLATRYQLATPNGAVGKSDADFYSAAHAARTRAEELAIMRSGFGVYNQLHHEKWQDGHETWNISTKLPLRDNAGKVIGTFGISHDITEHKEKEALIWRQAHHDGLTGLANRMMLEVKWEQLRAIAERSRAGLCLLLLDLDHFKEVNDTLGHRAGDQLIQQVAKRLQSAVRASDTVVRLGGDEFCILLNHVIQPIVAADVAQKVIHELAEPFVIDNESVFVTASIGVAMFPNDGQKLEDLFKHADQAMYQAKQQGRNRFSFFTESLEQDSRRRLRLGTDLQLALAKGQLRLLYQPVVDMATGHAIKAEALLRWDHPKLGPISPAEFIPIAESHGLITGLGDWVLSEGLHQIKHWRTLGHADLGLSINKSPMQMVRPHSSAVRLLRKLDLPGDALVLEITEGVILQPTPRVRERLFELRKSGIRLAIDDFGTGYSALSYLHQYDIQLLKIDHSFVREMTESDKNLAICHAIIQMAKALGIAVVAEGVETEVQHRLLREAGCTYGQGYWYGRPMEPAAFEDWLTAHPAIAK